MPLDAFGLDLAVKGILSTGITQLRLHSGDPGAAAGGNANPIAYAGLVGGPNVQGADWTFNADGTARLTGNADWPVPPDGYAPTDATWITAWRGANRIGRFRIQVRNAAQPDVNAADAYIDGAVSIAPQRIPRLTPDSFIWTVPAS